MIFGTIPTHPDAPAFSRDSCLTKREWLAGLAMQGIMADAENATLSDGTARGAGQYLCLNEGEYNFTEHYPALVAKSAVAYADALIAQLNKERQ